MCSISYSIFMPLSRTHIAFLGIISMITGMIAPGVGDQLSPLSYLMTDVRSIGYGILFLLVVSFALASLRAWRWYRVAVVCIFMGIGYLLFMTIFSYIHTIRDGMNVWWFQWGWIFLIIGCMLILISYRKTEGEKEDFSETIDALIGIIGGFALACIVGMLILSSLSFFGSDKSGSLLGELFGSGSVRVFSWGVMWWKTYETEPALSYNRKSDVLLIQYGSWWKTVEELFGSGEILSWSGEKTLGLLRLEKSQVSKNMLHTMSGEIHNGIIRLTYDGQLINRDLEEVRELYLGDDWSYAYFARPLGEKRFCIFTRYRWSLCGLDWYMSPTVGADGTSILFAGYKDKVWSVYRNTLRVVKNTGYTKTGGISNDYVFFDTTRPETYLFLEKDAQTGTYQYRKNGKLIEKRWKDVSLHISFGYDNHIITTAKDEEWWKVIEL